MVQSNSIITVLSTLIPCVRSFAEVRLADVSRIVRHLAMIKLKVVDRRVIIANMGTRPGRHSVPGRQFPRGIRTDPITVTQFRLATSRGGFERMSARRTLAEERPVDIFLRLDQPGPAWTRPDQPGTARTKSDQTGPIGQEGTRPHQTGPT